MPRTVHDLPHHTSTRRRLRTHGTPAEAALWSLLKNRQQQGRRFRRQHSVGPFVLDFYCPAERLAVELDGAVHDDPTRAAYDAERTAQLNRLNIQVVRFEIEDYRRKIVSSSSSPRPCSKRLQRTSALQGKPAHRR